MRTLLAALALAVAAVTAAADAPVSGRVSEVTVLPGRPDFIQVKLDEYPGKSFYLTSSEDAVLTVDGRPTSAADLCDAVLRAKHGLRATLHPLTSRYGLSVRSEFVTAPKVALPPPAKSPDAPPAGLTPPSADFYWGYYPGVGNGWIHKDVSVPTHPPVRVQPLPQFGVYPPRPAVGGNCPGGVCPPPFTPSK